MYYFSLLLFFLRVYIIPGMQALKSNFQKKKFPGNEYITHLKNNIINELPDAEIRPSKYHSEGIQGSASLAVFCQRALSIRLVKTSLLTLLSQFLNKSCGT